jgi:dCTP deaminase
MAGETEFDQRILDAEIERLSKLVDIPRDLGSDEHGVLLSDKIEHYCSGNYKLIDPFDKECLRPAGYDLRVGRYYAIRGVRTKIDLGQSFVIEPYQVAVIQTWETLNLPEFLIGRWNIRVSLAYLGLLWVGGAQVDPGFRGRLSCPIYNLSTQSVELKCGDKLAMIDFVTTTPYVEGISLPFRWRDGKKLIFQQYNADLCSGVEASLDLIKQTVKENESKLETRLSEKSEGLDQKLNENQNRIDTRIDTFLVLIFTVVAVLFAGLGIIATKGNDDPSFVSSPIWVAAVALYFALRPCAVAWAESKRLANPAPKGAIESNGEPRWVQTLRPRLVEVIIASIIVAASIGFNISHAYVSGRILSDQVKQSQILRESLEEQKRAFDSDLQVLRGQTDARIRALQSQMDEIRRK